MCSSKQVCNGELSRLHHNCGNYRKPSLTNAICGQNLAWGPPFFIAFLKTTQNFLQVGYLIYPKSMREKYGLNLYLSLNATPRRFSVCKAPRYAHTTRNKKLWNRKRCFLQSYIKSACICCM